MNSSTRSRALAEYSERPPNYIAIPRKQIKRLGMSTLSLRNGDIFVSVHIPENDLFGGVTKLLEVLRPNWDSNRVKFKVFTDGITNKLIACYLEESECDKDTVLVRIYGNKTDLLIDREAELRNIKILNKMSDCFAPKIYGVFENGIAYEYFPGVTLNTDTVLNPKIWTSIAQRMANMHKVDLGKEVPKEPFLWDKIEQFLRLLPEPFSDPDKQNRFVSSFGSVTKLRIEYERMKSFLSKVDNPIVFAHNDLLLGNVIHNEADGKISFIDYEYAAYNYQAFDIANHFNEFVEMYERHSSRLRQQEIRRKYSSKILNWRSASMMSFGYVFTDRDRLRLCRGSWAHRSWDP
ncbi:Ethanolamine kinase [Eumeta japonica]|uniref:ethanolamine kinase n=1 Tax=Eumeta variegata TaxID=151549 RepID=A0A4C1X6W2_EUMVA|nr:Ethanolamine kinase [Eumeta japonica]